MGVKKLLGACLHASKTTSTMAEASFTLTILSRGLRESSPERKNKKQNKIVQVMQVTFLKNIYKAGKIQFIFDLICATHFSQYAERILNKIAEPFNKTVQLIWPESGRIGCAAYRAGARY